MAKMAVNMVQLPKPHVLREISLGYLSLRSNFKPEVEIWLFLHMHSNNKVVWLAKTRPVEIASDNFAYKMIVLHAENGSSQWHKQDEHW